MNMKPKLIFIDIDGTLFDHAKDAIPESAKNAILSAKSKGHKIFLSTGRPYADIDQEILNFPLDGMIVSCGAVVYVDNKPIYCKTYPQKELISLIQFMLDNNIGFSLDGIHKNYLTEEAFNCLSSLMFKNNEDSELSRAMMAKNNCFPFEDMKEEDLKEVVKISIFTKNKESCEKLFQKIPESLVGFMYKNNHLHLYNGEISIKGITKATGLKQITNYLNIPIEDTIAIGDSLNDLDILQEAGLSICMGNGADECKKTADFVTKDVSDDGLAYALKHFNLAD
ncbi:HAD family hydrolase [Holdemanella biformis]|jgi:Cof subfamily protein (haloacid dehalogenase superfamily)|uniref:HAD family hydrolase n=1 Tax=Holdemanella biformis TaxID=1735 RepID=UPI0022E2CA73|nr:HAD family hydrolase [Holdemanella biformis]